MTAKSSDQINAAALHERRLAATPRGVGVMAGFYVDRALNAEVWDVDGTVISISLAASRCSIRAIDTRN